MATYTIDYGKIPESLRDMLRGIISNPATQADGIRAAKAFPGALAKKVGRDPVPARVTDAATKFLAGLDSTIGLEALVGKVDSGERAGQHKTARNLKNEGSDLGVFVHPVTGRRYMVSVHDMTTMEERKQPATSDEGDEGESIEAEAVTAQ